MNRRDLLKGALGAAAVAGSATAEASHEAPLAPAEVDRELQELRRDLDTLRTASDLGLGERWRQLASDANRPVDDEVYGAHEQLVRSTMRTLAIAETLSSLPAANRQDDAVLELVGEHAAEMEYAFQGQLALLQGLTREQKLEVRDALRRRPDLGLDVGDHLDGIARRGELGGRRRRRLKSLVKHTTWRLQRQPMDTVVDELLLGTDKLAEVGSDGVRERLRPTVEARGNVGHWNGQKQRLDRALRQSALPLPGDPDVDAGVAETDRSERYIRIAKTELTIGGILGGIGTLMVAGGALMGDGFGVAVLIAGLFPLTGFVVLMILGLVTLGIGLALRARRPPEGTR